MYWAQSLVIGKGGAETRSNWRMETFFAAFLALGQRNPRNLPTAKRVAPMSGEHVA
jgi:hypothetical protein